MKNLYNLNSMVSLLLANEVGFEVFYGENTSKRTADTRAAMLIELSPAVRIDFGDAKHGKLVSRIHVANNHKLTIRVEDLVQQIESFTSTAPWHTAANVAKHRTGNVEGLFSGAGTGTTATRGVLCSPIKVDEREDGVWLDFNLNVRNFLQVASTMEVKEIAPTIINVTYKVKSVEDAQRVSRWIVEADASYVEGTYIYPNQIVAAFIGGAEK